ncbi:hypothetical protein LB530_07955 [Mesorhizobium sp. CO1-1-3]|uniref:hypothetical protein n=1 Tax=Mesorhizobium sp. CO1-1-3 TaxID=2876634 RepID=UPI001CCD1971|nr:hypothetical protein [Mesorhizobium sp. CO1-1-3]MBZ9700817.1 hypothetical protein [Mesorhizobium sp. CO1-1-3]
MYLPQFLVGMFLTSGIVGLWAYAATGSVWSAAGWTIINLLILQIGYFAFVIRRVYKRTTADALANSAPTSHVQPFHRDGTLS